MRLVGQLGNTIFDRHAQPGSSAKTGLLHRPVWLLTGGIALLLLLAFGLLLYSSWRHDRELDPLERHLSYLSALESADQRIQDIIDKATLGNADQAALASLHEAMRRLNNSNGYLNPRSHELISAAQEGLTRFSRSAEPAAAVTHLNSARLLMRKALASEFDTQQTIMIDKRAAARREQHIALGLLIGLLMVLIPLGRHIRHHIIRPIDTLGNLMTLMSEQDYTCAPTKGVDPMLLPLFENYNRMVNRLVTLEQSHQRREDTLTTSVQQATRILLKQQQRVAQAERLGAVGEIAASVAHELRNPLTATHMALQNLRRDLSDPELIDRVDLILIEIRRINQQLNMLLEGARQTPEPLSNVDIVAVLRELRTLVRYQINERIDIDIDAPDELVCRLPEAQFRQCLLNLILNAAQIIGENAGRIRLTIKDNGDCAQLLVEDDGPGFPPEMLQNGVRAFGSWRRGGTGLGLIMVRRFVSDIGGSLRLENRTSRGARIILELPQGRSHYVEDAASH
ncbi:MAG: hypothetical protein LBV36_02755 [Chromatiales bacterium]|jgi:signal transduction histidine kinase|nr:hypothetical protein [Chromatiales bacterium]